MKKFLIKLLLFLSVVILTFGYIFSFADGYTDPFYMRFTTAKQKNLIIGTSRAAQGIQPQILNKKLNLKFFNYAFTVMHSPFGETYLNSIKSKLDESSKQNVL